MQETIQLLDKNNVAVTVFNTMCMKADKGDILDLFNIDPKVGSTVVNLQVLVNGVEVPAVEYMTSIVAQITDHINDRAKVLAKEMALGQIDDMLRSSIRSKLENIENLLDDVSTELDYKLNNWN